MTEDRLGNLVRRLQAQDPQVMADLYDLYGRLLFVLIVRIVHDPSVAEDLVQECFLRAWNRSGQLNIAYDSVGPWLTAIARNCAIDYLKSSQAHFSALVSIEEARFPAISRDNDILVSDRARVIEGALCNLTPEQKQVIQLSFYEGLSHVAIAERMQQPLGTVKGWARSALSNLRQNLDPHLANFCSNG
jgi:RNA polymerase sigma-70 factor (ECF subfamily)